jgi:uncharacterized protein YkwD
MLMQVSSRTTVATGELPSAVRYRESQMITDTNGSIKTLGLTLVLVLVVSATLLIGSLLSADVGGQAAQATDAPELETTEGPPRQSTPATPETDADPETPELTPASTKAPASTATSDGPRTSVPTPTATPTASPTPSHTPTATRTPTPTPELPSVEDKLINESHPIQEHPDDPGNETVSPPEAAEYSDRVDTGRVEHYIYEEVNAMRTGNLTDAELEMYNLTENLNLSHWSRHPPVESAARAQSAHIAHNEYFAHNTPDGKRYYEWYLGNMNRTRRNCLMTQNIAKTPLYIEVADREHEATMQTGNVDETFARVIVSQFMHSGPHKQALVEDSDAIAGFGVHSTDSHLYTTQNMCR